MKYARRLIIARRRAQDVTRGQTLVEYALILAILSVVTVSAMISLGSSLKGVYSSITSVVASAAASH